MWRGRGWYDTHLFFPCVTHSLASRRRSSRLRDRPSPVVPLTGKEEKYRAGEGKRCGAQCRGGRGAHTPCLGFILISRAAGRFCMGEKGPACSCSAQTAEHCCMSLDLQPAQECVLCVPQDSRWVYLGALGFTPDGGQAFTLGSVLRGVTPFLF